MSAEELTGSGAPPAAETAPKAAVFRLGRRWLAVLLMCLCGAFLGGGALWWHGQGQGLAPPEVELANLGPEVAQAIEEEQRKVRESPSADAWGRLGRVFLVHTFRDEAAICFAEAERLDPSEPRWPYYRGRIVQPFNPEAALPHLRRSVSRAPQAGPDQSAPRFLLMEALVALDRLEEAEAELALLPSRGSEGGRIRYARGVIAARRGNWQACADLLAPLTKAPQARQKSLRLLAAAYGRLGKPLLAAEFAYQARQAPHDVPWEDPYLREEIAFDIAREARFNKIQHLEDRASVTEILRLIEDTNASEDRALLLLANALARLKQLDQAEQAVRRALALQPDRARSLITLASILYTRAERLREQRGEKDKQAEELVREVVALARRALGQKPNDPLMLSYVGRGLRRLGKREEGLAALRQAALCRPEWLGAQYYLGEALMEDRHYAEARVALERAARLAPANDPLPANALKRLAELEKPKAATPGPGLTASEGKVAP